MPSPSHGQEEPRSPKTLVGLWQAKLRYGPDTRGSLTIAHDGGAWHAEIAGRTGDVTVADGTLRFELAGNEGAFIGRFEQAKSRIVGHWIQPRTVTGGTRFASPVTLRRDGRAERWRGTVDPLDDEFTMYLKVDSAADGRMRVFLRNPERNLGRYVPLTEVERDGDRVRLVGLSDGKRFVLSEGELRDGELSLPLRGGTFDFDKVEPDQLTDFYPRGRPGVGASYRYAVPPTLEDGWPVSTPEDVGLSRAALEQFMRTVIDMPIDGVSAPEIHGVLIARHGRLVLEEYFHGEHRDKPHDTRSASKSVISTLIGAAMRSGVPLSESSSAYQVMAGGRMPAGLEPRKRALTLAHLLTMSSGLDCDDRDSASPGNEDTMLDQDREPDYYQFILALGMIRDPGQQAVYCSINPHLAGGMLARASGRTLPDLFQSLVAEPLGIRRYYMNLTPTGDGYGGGGLRLLPRDFLKFSQLMLNDGVWQGRRVTSADWARRATAPLVELRGLRYGYFWWSIEYPFRGKSVRAFFAAGNGGQLAMAIPDLDL
ncbi:MAG: serine hydrolase, partial [Gemmatimonadaceae bacterium]